MIAFGRFLSPVTSDLGIMSCQWIHMLFNNEPVVLAAAVVVLPLIAPYLIISVCAFTGHVFYENAYAETRPSVMWMGKTRFGRVAISHDM